MGAGMRLFIALLMAIFSCSVVCAEDEIANGYTWEEAPFVFKVLIMNSYIAGYKAGTMMAVPTVFSEISKFTAAVGESDIMKKDNAKLAKDYMACNKLINDSHTALMQVIFGDLHTFDYKNEGEYYVREVDSFLKTYPLCKRKSVMPELLLLMTNVWFNLGEVKSTYKSIGEECATAK